MCTAPALPGSAPPVTVQTDSAGHVTAIELDSLFATASAVSELSGALSSAAAASAAAAHTQLSKVAVSALLSCLSDQVATVRETAALALGCTPFSNSPVK